MSEYSLKLKFQDVPVLFTFTSKLGVQGSRVFPSIKNSQQS